VNDTPATTSGRQHRVTTPTRLVEAYFAAFGSGDLDGALALLTEDVIWHVDGAVSVSTVGLLQGRERVRRWLERFPQNFKPLVFAIDRLFESGDEVMAVGRFRHRVLATSRTAGSDLAIRFTVRDGQIARYQILEDSLLLARAFDPDDRWDTHQVKVNGATYSYTHRGEGPVVVFAHGLFVDHTIFDAQVADLESTHRCISLDMPGHGRSGYHEAGWTLDDIADDLALLIEEQSLGPVAFVGQSQGGMVGIRLAARRPELVSKLVLIGTSARPEDPARLGDWHALRNTILTGSEAEREAAFTGVQKHVNSSAWLDDQAPLATKERAIMLSHDRAGVTLALDAAVIEREDTQALLANITAPTLVICGAADRATPVALSREIASAIPSAQIEILPGVGHHPPLEAPHEVAASLRQFLA
jgi:3-oxoadipate enol-lactonase